MAFELLTWAFGYGLTSSAKWLLDQPGRRTLAAELDRAAQSWADALPPEFAVQPVALFASATDTRDAPGLAAQRVVHETLAAGRIPTDTQWMLALEELWRFLKEKLGSSGTSFFQRTTDQVQPHLHKLAEALTAACRTQEALFRATVLSALLEDPSARLPEPLDANAVDPRSIGEAIDRCGATCEVVVVMPPRIAVWIRPEEPVQKKAIMGQVSRIAVLLARLQATTSIEIGVGDTRHLEHRYEVKQVGFFRFRIASADALEAAIQGQCSREFWDKVLVDVVSDENSPSRSWLTVTFPEFERRLP